MIVVLDPSVVIAAFAGRGICEAIFAHCLECHEVYLGPTMRDAICRELVGKIGVPEKIARDIEAFLKITPWPREPAPVETGLTDDPLHLLALGTALAAKADYIITGAPDLLALREHHGTRIVDPRTFYDIIMNTDSSATWRPWNP